MTNFYPWYDEKLICPSGCSKNAICSEEALGSISNPFFGRCSGPSVVRTSLDSIYKYKLDLPLEVMAY